MDRDQRIKELERCVRCGGCKTVCPTFLEDGTEPMGARGRLMLLRGLLRGDLVPSQLMADRIYSCLLCGKCEAACPSGVNVTAAIYHSRQELRKADFRLMALGTCVKAAFQNPQLAYKALRLARPILPWLHSKGIIPYELNIPDSPLRSGMHVLKPSTKKIRNRVAIFTGCAINYTMPHLGESLIRVLLHMGYEVVLPSGEVCCGAPLMEMGYEAEAMTLAKRNIVIFARLKARAVLSLCPTCTLTIKNTYADIAGQGLPTAMDAMEFLGTRMDMPVQQPQTGSVLYHDPCHLRYGLGVKKEPREILRKLGYDYIDPVEPSCCGFSVGLTHGTLSSAVLDKTREEYSKANTVVTACPGCIMQLRRAHPSVRHLIELVDEGITGPMLF